MDTEQPTPYALRLEGDTIHSRRIRGDTACGRRLPGGLDEAWTAKQLRRALCGDYEACEQEACRSTLRKRSGLELPQVEPTKTPKITHLFGRPAPEA